MINIRYASIRSMDISNGEGIGVALFVQGCNFHCKNCFNPETWDFKGGKEWTQEVKNRFLELANRPYIKRISILGGEPLADENLDDVLDLVNKLRLSSPRKTIWLYTGYTTTDVINQFWLLWTNVITEKMLRSSELIEGMIRQNKKRSQIISKCDVLIDGQYIDSQRDVALPYRGSRNQRIIDVQKSIKQNKVVLYCN